MRSDISQQYFQETSPVSSSTYAHCYKNIQVQAQNICLPGLNIQLQKQHNELTLK